MKILNLNLFGCLLVKAVMFQCRSQHPVKSTMRLVSAFWPSNGLCTYEWTWEGLSHESPSLWCLVPSVRLATWPQPGNPSPALTQRKGVSLSVRLATGHTRSPASHHLCTNPTKQGLLCFPLHLLCRCPLPSALDSLSISLPSHLQPLSIPCFSWGSGALQFALPWTAATQRGGFPSAHMHTE